MNLRWAHSHFVCFVMRRLIIIAVIILKFEQCAFTIDYYVQKVQMERQRVQTKIILLLMEQADLNLHCLSSLV